MNIKLHFCPSTVCCLKRMNKIKNRIAFILTSPFQVLSKCYITKWWCAVPKLCSCGEQPARLEKYEDDLHEQLVLLNIKAASL